MALEKVFIDTSAFFAYLVPDDKNHKIIKQYFSEKERLLFTSNFVVDELVTLLKVRGVPVKYYIAFIDAIFLEKVCSLIRVTPEIEKAAWRLFQKYDDQVFSFTDCTSFALMKVKKIRKALTLDSDFQIVKFEVFPNKE